LKVCITDDVVAVKDAAGLMASELHRQLFPNACLN